MKLFKHSKFEILVVVPTDTIDEIENKKKLPREIHEKILKSDADAQFVVFDKKEDKCYGIVDVNLDEWDGIATLDFSELENHPDEKIMYSLVHVLCSYIENISHNCHTVLIQNHLFNKNTLNLLFKEGFGRKNKGNDSEIFLRTREKELGNFLIAIGIVLLLMFLSITL